MTIESFIAVCAIALGTYLLRYLPLRASARNLHAASNRAASLNRCFEIAGICVIAALFLHSVSLPGDSPPSIAAVRLTASLAAVAGASHAWKNPGVGVLAGILCFALFPLLL
ncbi:MAG: AzlD domain-containing protein [Desulfohalobiaceae bacterium]